jgi:DNA-binding CsgD family transcriptional regulator
MSFEKFVIESNKASCAEAAFTLFVDAMQGFGFDSTVFSLLTDHPSIGFVSGHGIANNYPEDWMEYYLAQNYQHIDPVPKQAFRSTRAFSWDKLIHESDLTEAETLVMNQAQEAKLLSGVGIPLYGRSMEIAGFGLACKDGGIDINDNLLSVLQAFAYQFYQVYASLIKVEQEDKIALTKREREVLLWMAEGKTLAEIAIILNVGEETVRYYKKILFSKLKANQQTLAVLKAIRSGLINPYRLDI